jgi:formyltetrahydrofolate synthetase
MENETKELLKEIKAYRNDMVARNYPHQQISNIITKWEMKKDFLEEAEKEKAELNESYKESVRQTKERKNFIAKAIDGYGE